MKAFRYYGIRLLFSLFLLAFLVGGPEFVARGYYRLRHGAWPVSLAAAASQSKREVKSLFAEHSLLPFVLRPGAKVPFMDTYAEINTGGFRGPELRTTTPLRIMVLGGSTTFDTGVTDDGHTWCRQLEKELDAVFPGVEIVNGGVPTYGTWANCLKYLLYDYQTKADVVVIYQGLNDLLGWTPASYGDLPYRDHWLYRGSCSRAWSGLFDPKQEQVPVAGLLAHSVLLRGACNERGRNDAVFAGMNWAQNVDECMPELILRKNCDLLTHFVALIRQNGAVPIVVPQGIGSQTRTRVGQNFGVWVKGLRRLDEAYLACARDLGVKTIDILEPAAHWEDAYFQDWAHFNDVGAQGLASLLARELEKDEDLSRLFAAHRDTPRVLPTQVFEKAVVLDDQPDLPEVQEVALSLTTSPALQGFGELHGPFPNLKMPHKVRWMQGKQAEIKFHCADAKRYCLRVHVLTPVQPQTLTVYMNGELVLTHAFAQLNDWVQLTCPAFQARDGANTLTFRATQSTQTADRETSILFDEIRIDVE
jgi:lysophospholipase L1-like esterase